MRALLAIVFLSIPSLLFAADPPSVHGMLIFGRGTTYLSHLPMFHSPHDYQAILEAELPGSAKQVLLDDQKAHPEQTVYTLVPTPFVLPDMIAKLGSFRASIVRGHFERGGVTIINCTPVMLKRVVLFQKLDENTPQPGHPSYLVFGNGGENYAAHLIHGAPDFDQVLAVEAPPGTVELGDRPFDQAIGTDESAVPGLGKVQSLYLELDDLRKIH